VIAINLREGDELISAQLVDTDGDLLLVSRMGMSVRCTADDATLRPMGRATSGVIGMRFREGDQLLAMDVVREGCFVVTVTDGGFAKRTPVTEWAPKGRGIYGVRAMKLVEQRGSLVGALVAHEDDEVYAIASDGVVIRTRVAEVRATSRDTMGVGLMNVGEATIVGVALGDSDPDEDVDADPAEAEGDTPGGAAVAPEGLTTDSSDTVSGDSGVPEHGEDPGSDD
jgi:DNA gyrase subunit A